jgi:hypothetical protein
MGMATFSIMMEQLVSSFKSEYLFYLKHNLIDACLAFKYPQILPNPTLLHKSLAWSLA